MFATIPLNLVASEAAVGRPSTPHDSSGPQPPGDVTLVDVP